MQGKSCEERIDATEEFFKLAGEQQVLETVCVGLGWRVPSEVRLRALKRIGFNDNKMRAAFSLIRLLEENGISACVLKGEAVASLYGTPECRISGDVDIFVGERISESVAVLEKAGCDFPRKDTPKHLVCRHPQAGIIELHDRLVSDTYLDLFFENAFVIIFKQTK